MQEPLRQRLHASQLFEAQYERARDSTIDPQLVRDGIQAWHGKMTAYVE